MDRFLRALRHPVTIRASQLLLGVLFGIAALGKLGDLRLFALQVHNFRMAPIALENLLAMSIPWIELVSALAMVLKIRPRAGSWVAGALLVVFTVAVAVAMARGLDVECGCFGSAGASRVGVAKLLENLALLSLAGIGIQRRE